MTEAGPLVQLQISLSRVPWRIAPAWSVLAGALAVGTPLNDPALWLRVVAAIVLGDLAWGVLRRYVPLRGAGPGADDGLTAFLPYAQPDAPVSHLIRELALEGANSHGAFAGIVLVLGGALLLGLPAFALSVVAIIVTVVAWSIARRGDLPAAGFALLDVFLPFTLGLLAAGWFAQRPLAWQPLLVAAAFTALHWGALRAAGRGDGKLTFNLGLGALAVIAALVGLGMPWAAAVAGVLLAPALYWLGRPRATADWPAPWSMLALFVAALALR